LWECCVTAFALTFSSLSCSLNSSTVATQHTIRDRTILSPPELLRLIFSFGSFPHPCSCPGAPGVPIGTVPRCRGCVRGFTAGVGPLRFAAAAVSLAVRPGVDLPVFFPGRCCRPVGPPVCVGRAVLSVCRAGGGAARAHAVVGCEPCARFGGWWYCESPILATVSRGVNLAHGVMKALGGGQ